MKKIMILLLVLGAISGLFAQRGLFNLSYGNTMAEVDSILALHTFYPAESGKNYVKYYSDINELVESIMVFVHPASQRTVGWFIKYSRENSRESDELVIQRIMNMHGEKNHLDKETGQLIWFLSTTRSLHLIYAEDESLTALYFDSYFADLFQVENGQ
ncbi:MAG: hypothetical protein PHC50_10815 [Candidatus Cloacimonetes bacterium]|nr:hypothetical protein [Candidatus Cloacimonadota bacterium]